MPAVPAWVRDFTGIPFVDLGLDRTGCNCWGLVRLVYAERLGVHLPSYVGGYQGVAEADATDIARLVRGGVVSDGWQELDWRAADDSLNWRVLKPYDGVLLRIKGHPMHMSLIVERGWILHTMPRDLSKPERVDNLRWRNRIHSIYRHKKLI